jgi:hypothetical protein
MDLSRDRLILELGLGYEPLAGGWLQDNKLNKSRDTTPLTQQSSCRLRNGTRTAFICGYLWTPPEIWSVLINAPSKMYWISRSYETFRFQTLISVSALSIATEFSYSLLSNLPLTLMWDILAKGRPSKHPVKSKQLDPENWWRTFFRNVSGLVPDYRAQHTRR